MKKFILCLVAVLLTLALPAAARAAEGTPALTNGDFSAVESDGFSPTGWGRSYGSAAVAGVNYKVLENQYNGKNALWLYDPNDSGNAHYKHMSLGQTVAGLIPGAEYTITGYSKMVKKGTSQGGVIKVTCGTEHDITAYYSALGVWEKQSLRFVVPDGVSSASILIRLVGGGEILWADMQLTCTKKYVSALDTDAVFYYTDQTTGTAALYTNHNLASAFADGSVNFAIEDGASVLWQENAALTEGVAKVSFPLLSTLTTEEKAYTLRATLLDANEAVLESTTQSIYRYKRPSMIGADGTITVQGKEITPVFAYHVRKKHYEACAKAGINIIQNAKHSTVQGYIDMLDGALDANGKPIVYMLLPLYNSMKPAGHPANLALTKAVAQSETVRNHPAFFGYLVMDEPFLNMDHPEEHLERAYTAIREYDDAHPIFIMENYSDKYSTTVKYADILGADIYAAGATDENPVSAYVSHHAALGREAAGDKPFWVLLQTFDYVNYFPTAAELRGQMYQAAFAGADALGFYKIERAADDKDLNDIPALWNMISDMCTGAEYSALVGEKAFTESTSATSLSRRWENGEEKYVQLLNRTMELQTVEVPLGTLLTGLYTAEILWGDASGAEVDLNRGMLRVTLSAAAAATVRVRHTAADYYAVDSETGVAVDAVYGGQTVDIVLAAGKAGLAGDSLRFATAFYADGAAPELCGMQLHQTAFSDTVRIEGVTIPAYADAMHVYFWPDAVSFSRLIRLL